MTQSSKPEPPNAQRSAPPPAAGAISLTGGAAIVAPITAFPNGVPSNALVLIPLGANGAPIEKQIAEGPVALKMEEVWKLLGFNGPAVQVQDEQGRPITIGLEDLLAGLEKHWNDTPDDMTRGRIFAQELVKHGRYAKAETVLKKLVAQGGLAGDDWLALGVTQYNLEKYVDAEKTLKGAQNLMKDSPYPSLHLARLFKATKDARAERESVDRAIQVEPQSVDAWSYLFTFLKEQDGEDKAVAAVVEQANAPVNARASAPYIALQGQFVGNEATREKALDFAKKAVERAPSDPRALICLSAIYGQMGKLEDILKLLAPHEALMQKEVRLANNYFEALFQSRDMQRTTALLNKLATSPVREVKQFAVERSRAIAQMLQQQQASLQAGRV